MNDDMDKPLNTVGDDALEARITAWVLGEASSFEAGEVEKLCAADPVLGLFERRLRELHGLVAEDFKAGPSAEWKLAAERRTKITDLLGVEPEVVRVPPRRDRHRGSSLRGLILALAACVVIGFVSYSLIGGVGSGAKYAVMKESARVVSYSAPIPDAAVESRTDLRERAGGAPVAKPRTAYAHLDSQSPFTSKSPPPPSAARAELPEIQGMILEREELAEGKPMELAANEKNSQGLRLDATAPGASTRADVEAKVSLKTAEESLARMSQEAAGLSDQPMAANRELEALSVPLPPPASLPVVPMADPVAGPAPEAQALAANEPQSAVKAKNFGANRSDHEIGYAGGGGGVGGGLPAEEAPPVASRSNADFIPQIATREMVPAEGMTIPGEPAATGEAASDFITGGNRSGDAAISRNSIDAILNNPERIGSKAGSGSLALTGTAAADDLADRQLDTKGAALEANGGVEAGFGYVMGRGAEGALSKGVKVSPPLNANLSVADSRALGETRDDLSGEGRTSGVAGIVGSDDSERLTRGGETGKPVDLLATGNALFDADAGGMPQDPQSVTLFNTNGTAEPRLRSSVRLGGERTDYQGDATTFGDLDEMGRLAEASKSQGERLGTHTGYRYANGDGQVMDGIADLSDLARKQSEAGASVAGAKDLKQPSGGSLGGIEDSDSNSGGFDESGDRSGLAWKRNEAEPAGTINGRWMGRTADEPAKEPAAPQVGEELAEADERGLSGADGFFKTPAPAQAPPASAPASAIEFNGSVQGGAPVEWQTKTESAQAGDRGTAEVTSGLLTETVSGGLKADMTIEALTLSKTLETAPAKPEDEVRAQLLKEVEKAWELSVPPTAETAREGQKAEADGKPGAVDPIRTNPALAADGGAAVDEVRRKLYIAEGSHNLGKYEDAQKAYEDVLKVDPYNKAARRGMEKVAQARSDYYRAAYDQTRGELLAEVDKGWDEATIEDKKQIALDLMSEVVSADEPFSTFSLHVSDASFKLAHAAMERGEVPAAEGIRPEEFYNAFDYGDPAPASGEPVVCVTEQSAHPAFAQRNLMRIAVRTGSQGRGASTPLNLTLLLDHSGSMEREDRNAGLAMAVRQLSGLLKEGDTITVAGFSRQPRLLADRLPGARAQELNELIARTPSEGGTNLEEGLKLGEELAKRQFNPAAQNRVVLFTDGAANLGDARPEALQARIEGLRQQGIAFDAAGFGADGLNDKLLERLTRDGNGRYYIVDGPEDADAGFAKQLAGAFRPAAENVKVQVRFNPARVAKYKLIGFEEHRLQKEDFRNDAVDAAEMAAEEAGNALYQIETLPQGEGEVGEVSVRFHDVASGQMVERTWTIPYDAEAPAFDQATPSIQLAGLAAFTAEKLRAAPMADAVDFQQLGQVYAGVRARYPNSQPVADLGSMIGKMK